MPIRSPENVPGGTVRELGLPARAVTALTRAGVTDIEDLALLTRRDLAAIAGLGAGMIAAIRLVVPEPARRVPVSGDAPVLDHEQLPPPDREPAEEESPAAPMIPSFASLRAPRRRTAVDVLVPEQPAATGAVPAGVPRPPEYADLWRLGVRVVRAVAGVPWRAARWSVREPARCLHHLLGE